MTLASLLGLLGAGSAQAQKKLVVYTSNESTLNDLVFGAFKKETGIEVEPVAAGSGVVIRRLQAEKARPLGDIIWGVSRSLLQTNKTLFEPYASKNKESVPMDEFTARVSEMLVSIQDSLYVRVKEFQDANTNEINSKEDFYDFFTAKNPSKPEIHGGFALAHWNGSREIEEQIKNDLKVTIRVIPLDDSPETGHCIFTGEPSTRRVVWAKSY
jgi:hypothetical protein